ncbi:DUF3326 domain-containing protein [Kovacikia minuta]|uniref:DUF3326 domain-containing protein n=1 Tax=Kovacikia minuta TaxID=2931930 RepID=UPI0036F3F6BF
MSRAPQFVVLSDPTYKLRSTDIWADQVDAVVIPATASGGSSILSFSQIQTQLIAVQDNTTTMQVASEALGISAIQVNSYLEALGYLVAHRAGISAAALKPAIPSLGCLKDWSD